MDDTSRRRGERGSQGPGGGRRGGPRRDGRRGRDGRGEAQGERSAGPADEVTVVVDRREGVRVLKVSRIERVSHRILAVLYRVEFEGCGPIEFDRLGPARDRAKEPPPERPSSSDAQEESGGEEAPATAEAEEAGGEDAGSAASRPG